MNSTVFKEKQTKQHTGYLFTRNPYLTTCIKYCYAENFVLKTLKDYKVAVYKKMSSLVK